MTFTSIEIKKLATDAPIPYDLLLLADETVEAINQYLTGSDIYIAMQPNEQQPIGAMVLQEQNQQEAEIMNIAVAEHFQSQGIGKLLIEKAVEVSQSKGYTSLKVGTGDSGYRQISFYRRNGFEVCEVRKNYFVDKFPEPVFENGVMLKDMVVLERKMGECHKSVNPI